MWSWQYSQISMNMSFIAVKLTRIIPAVIVCDISQLMHTGLGTLRLVVSLIIPKDECIVVIPKHFPMLCCTSDYTLKSDVASNINTCSIVGTTINF